MAVIAKQMLLHSVASACFLALADAQQKQQPVAPVVLSALDHTA